MLVCRHKTCEGQGAESVLKELKRTLKDAGLREQVLVTKVNCLDQCGRGPVMVVYPEGVWYGGVSESCVRAIAMRHTGRTGHAACEILRDMRDGAEGVQ